MTSDTPKPGPNAWFIIVILLVPTILSIAFAALTSREYGIGGLIALAVSAPAAGLVVSMHIVQRLEIGETRAARGWGVFGFTILFAIFAIGLAWGTCAGLMGAFG